MLELGTVFKNSGNTFVVIGSGSLENEKKPAVIYCQCTRGYKGTYVLVSPGQYYANTQSYLATLINENSLAIIEDAILHPKLRYELFGEPIRYKIVRYELPYPFFEGENQYLLSVISRAILDWFPEINSFLLQQDDSKFIITTPTKLPAKELEKVMDWLPPDRQYIFHEEQPND